MKPFSKNELIGVASILTIIILLSLYNFRIALRRSRDTQRRSDLGQIANAIEKYQADFGFFPLSSEGGEIKACIPANFKELVEELSQKKEFDYEKYLTSLNLCTWGVDSLRDLADDSFTPYLSTIPKDPRNKDGFSYFYFSNSHRYQIYAYLEGGDTEIGYSSGIVGRNLNCGSQICNFGKAFSETPLEKSIEEYENELLQDM